MTGSRFFLVGGAGFIGGHFADRLLAEAAVQRVTVFDNFSSGREWHLASHRDDARLAVIRADVKDLAALVRAMTDHDVVIHLASNPDIARAVTDPDVDFREGTCLTEHVVEAMRITSTRRLLYASGSGVYGDIGSIEAKEDFGPLIPVSTYGASKLAGEALISSYCHMFDLSACVFRFGNVVGPRQTHGVGFDFLRSLLKDPTHLRILGDGSQSKSYVHVDDVISAVLCAHERTAERFRAYNVATGDYITVTEIARIVCQCAGLDPAKVRFEYSGGDRGWKGDVPIVRLNIDRIRALGWKPFRLCGEAIRDSVNAMFADAQRLYNMAGVA